MCMPSKHTQSLRRQQQKDEEIEALQERLRKSESQHRKADEQLQEHSEEIIELRDIQESRRKKLRAQSKKHEREINSMHIDFQQRTKVMSFHILHT